MKKVKDIMSRRVKTCRTDNNLAFVAGLMWDYDIGALPVLDDNNQVVGVITDHDITNAVAIRGKLAADISVGEAMSLKLYTCSPDDRLRDAIDIMRSAAVRRLPVVDDDNR